jgi:hypothetical protein
MADVSLKAHDPFEVGNLASRDALQRLLLPRKVPILEQFLAMRRGPLHHKAKGARRQVAFENGRRFDRHDCALVGVSE